MNVVLSLGGSLLINESFSSENIAKYVSVITTLRAKKHNVFVVVGGGKIARQYIDAASGLDLTREQLDMIAVSITHANALILSSALSANQIIPRNEQELKKMIKGKKLFVCGGTKPKQSTDGVAAFVASIVKADLLINASNVDGVYSADPRQFSNATKFDSLTYNQLEQIIAKHEESPGNYPLFDRNACKLVRKHNIKTYMVNGKDPANILAAAAGKKVGTVIYG